MDIKFTSEVKTEEEEKLNKFLEVQMGEPTHLLPKADVKTVIALNRAIQSLIDIEPIIEEHPFYYQGMSSITGILSDILHTMEQKQTDNSKPTVDVEVSSDEV